MSGTNPTSRQDLCLMAAAVPLRGRGGEGGRGVGGKGEGVQMRLRASDWTEIRKVQDK